MSVGKIKKISVAEKEYLLKDLNINSTSETVKNFKLEDVEYEGVSPSEVESILLRGEYNYMHANNKRVYMSSNRNLIFYTDEEFVMSFDHSIDVINVLADEMGSAIVVYDKRFMRVTNFYYLYKDNLLGGVSALQVCGRILLLRDGTLMVSAPFDYKGGSISFNFYYIADVPVVEFGYGRALVKIKNKVFVITEKSILYFYLAKKDRDSICEKLVVPLLDVYKTSVIVIDDNAYMISHNRLSKFDGEKVICIESLLDELNVLEFTNFSTDGVRYFVNLKLVDGAQYTYAYDTITGEEILGEYYKLICRDLPYVYDAKTDAIRLIKIESQNIIKAEGCLETMDDLGTCAEKIVTGYEMHVIGTAEVIISGKFGEKTFNLNNGCNSLRCNLNSKEYRFKFVNPSNDFKIIKAKIKYRTCGE